jgi:hypothetical protein
MAKIEEIRKRLASTRFSTRKRGMQELLESGARDEFIALALAEKDKDIVFYAVEWLHPHPPPALLVHCFHLGRQPTPQSAVQFLLSQRNYLYAEAEILEHYAPQGTRLALGTIEAVGSGYLRGFAPVLGKFLKQDLELASLAYQRLGAKAVTGGIHAFRKAFTLEYTNLENEWSTPSQKIIAAAVAMRRIDADIPRADLDRLLAQERAANWLDKRELPVDVQPYRSALEWVALGCSSDAEIRAELEGRGLPKYCHVPDLGTTLLKRGMTDLLDKLVGLHGATSFYRADFCHWPLLDYLVNRNLIQLDQQLGAKEYLMNRNLGVEPPPWWRWLD